MVTNILVGGILNTMWKKCDSISPMQGSGATSRASLPSRKFLCPRWNSIQFWWFEGATPLKIQYAVPCPGPLPCQFHSSLKWLHNCTGSATWCACNAKAELISNKVSCEHPGGGRDEVCQWCTWHIEAELGWRTAASISLYTELLQLVPRCLKQIFPVNSPLVRWDFLLLLLLSASSHGKFADSLCHPDLDFLCHPGTGQIATLESVALAIPWTYWL